MYEQYLIRLLAPLGLYDLRAPHNGGELAALGGELDSVSGLVELVERGIHERVRFSVLQEILENNESEEDRREAIAALLRISEDSLTPEAINDTLTGCGIRARAEEKADGSLRVVFPRTAGVPAEFDQIRKIILDILPCHLEVEFYFRYLTWAECEAAEYTWDEVETAQHTWESFQLAVPPEE